MNRRFALPAATVGAVLGMCACGSGGGSGATSGSQIDASASATSQAHAAAVAVGVGSSPLGRILVDGNGRTLYLFEADTGTQSTCSGACAKVWPPLTTSGAVIGTGGASQPSIGTAKRLDGSVQVTFGGHPLYYFVSDTKAGDVTGEGLTSFGAGWDVLSPTGDKIEQPGG